MYKIFIAPIVISFHKCIAYTSKDICAYNVFHSGKYSIYYFDEML